MAIPVLYQSLTVSHAIASLENLCPGPLPGGTRAKSNGGNAFLASPADDDDTGDHGEDNHYGGDNHDEP
jgi:hypothetical protein